MDATQLLSQCCDAPMVSDTQIDSDQPCGICASCRDWAGFHLVDEDGNDLSCGTEVSF